MQWNALNPEAIKRQNRRAALKRYGGMTLKDYADLSAQQASVCAICRRSVPDGKRLHVDHDHRTLQVRGLLCQDCNLGLGNFMDDPEVLERASAYLQGPPATLRDGRTFMAVNEPARPKLGAWGSNPAWLLIAAQLKQARSGRPRRVIAAAVGVTIPAITALESGYKPRVDLDVFFALTNYYGMIVGLSQSQELVVMYDDIAA